MAIQTRLVEYVVDGVVLEGLLAWDAEQSGPRPAVAIAHTWGGRSEFEEGKARQLAEQGYAAFAVDMYGKGVRGSDPEQNAALMAPLMADRASLEARINGAVTALREQPEHVHDLGFQADGPAGTFHRTFLRIDGESGRSLELDKQSPSRGPQPDGRRLAALSIC